MRITRSSLLQDLETAYRAPAMPPTLAAPAPTMPPQQAPQASRTRYAIRHVDGRWLTLVYSHGAILPVWIPASEHQQAWTWPSMMSALGAALDVDQIDLPASGPWTVQPVVVASGGDQ